MLSSWQSSALVRPTKTLHRNFAPVADDKEPIGESRADVEMGNEEDEEPLEAEIPRVRMNPKNPTSREKQQGHAVYRSLVCCLCRRWRCTAKRERRVVNGKVPQHTPFHLLLVSSKILYFAESF